MICWKGKDMSNLIENATIGVIGASTRLGMGYRMSEALMRAAENGVTIIHVEEPKNAAAFLDCIEKDNTAR